MLNILYMTENFQDVVRQDALYYLEQEVGKNANCRWAGIGWPYHRLNESIDRTVRRVMPNADWVIYFDFGAQFRRTPTNIPPKNKRGYKVGAYIVDLHRHPSKYVRRLNNSGVDVALMTTIRLGKQLVNGTPQSISPNYYIDHLEIPFFHMAPCINPEIYKPIVGKKQFDASLLGAKSPLYYPLRQLMWDELPSLANKEGWKTLIRDTPPGKALDKNISRLAKEGYFVGEKYATALALSKVFLFGTSSFKYPLMKFYEGMACGTCVVADVPLSAEELHLIPDWNFVAVDKSNWKEKLKYYVKHDGEREEIAQRGYETVMKYHTAEVRAKQLVRFLETNHYEGSPKSDKA